MTTDTELTALERTCIRTIADSHWPSLDLSGLRAESRERTGVGAYVNLLDPVARGLTDGVYEAGDRIIEMEGLTSGLDFALTVSGGRFDLLELVVPGLATWDGVERSWKIA